MLQTKFDIAFKPTVDDLNRGDSYSATATLPLKEYPEFGRTPQSNRQPIASLKKFTYAQAQIFKEKYFFGASAKETQNITGDNLKNIRVLGKGLLCNVTMVKCNDNGIYYAKKSIPKQKLVSLNKVNQAKNEKRILDAIRFPFTVHLKYFLQDSSEIHFLLPLCAGGDLYFYLKRNKRLKERLAKFIISQVILGLEYLHFIGLILRDLKLEHLLIDHYGYIKISNFGMSKLIGRKRTYTICGTADYMAPEVISQKGYGYAADWWSFGVLLYELCNGLSPFHADETFQIFHLILYCDYSMPVHFSVLLQDLVNNLLQVDLSKRFGNLRNGIDDIKNHPWCNGIQWLAIMNRQVESPLIPFISNEDDMSFFEPTMKTIIVKEEAEIFAEEFKNF